MDHPFFYLHSTSPTKQKPFIKTAAMAAIGNNVTKQTSLPSLPPPSLPPAATAAAAAIQPATSQIDDVVVNSIIYAKPSFCSIVADISSSSKAKKTNSDGGSDVNLISSIVKGNTIPCLSKLIADLVTNNTTSKQDAQLYKISTTINGSINHHISNICENLLALSLLKTDSDSSSDDDDDDDDDENDDDDDDDDDSCDENEDDDYEDSDDSLIEFASEADEHLIAVNDIQMYTKIMEKPFDSMVTMNSPNTTKAKILHKVENVFTNNTILHNNDSQSYSHVGIDVVDFIKVSSLTHSIITTNHIICQNTLKKKVRFNTNNSVHVMRTWDFAYRAARRGEWEIYARDRERFKMRIQRAAIYLNPILLPEHRERIRQQRFITLLSTNPLDTDPAVNTAIKGGTITTTTIGVVMPREKTVVNVKLVCNSNLDSKNYSQLKPKLSKLAEIENLNYANQRPNNSSKKCKMRRKANVVLYYSYNF